ncbi:TonB-dependent receptor [Hephaestia caeni]|uniref:TonB-dependent receptor n=1 Tax=Hephaestia caeni TaxID=645617 RepID=A0A397PCA3_9SPHN|nr:TonB-dependent receptor [Hephaestia caeni]RIA43764.1 TonB-dependent receptor [Hephaestia caeni]
MSGAAMCALITVAAPAWAQDQAQQPAADQSQEAVAGGIIVTGVRASLRSAQEIKRNSDSIADSIVAEDIGKLPDVNVTEALQRITGVQIGRDYGEGSSVAIRGLSQVETTLNGREVFTAGAGRDFNFQDLAAELIAGIDVYKAPTADLIEGGIGGTIDVRTHMPLDFDGFTLSGSARARYNDLADKVSPLLSALVSDRWDTGIGEIGIMIAGAYQERDFRNDGISSGAPIGRDDIIPGRTIATPDGTYSPSIIGNRTRKGIDAALQWRPSSELEFYAQGNYSKFDNITDQWGLNVRTASGSSPTVAPVPGSFTTFDGTDIFKSGSFANDRVSTFAAARDVFDENQAYSIGGKWQRDGFQLKADVSRTKSRNDLSYIELDLVTVAPIVHQDNSGSAPSMVVEGVDMTSLGSYNIGNYTLSENHYKGDMWAATLDAAQDLDGPITQIAVGFRYADRSAYFTPVRFFAAPPGSPAATAFPDLFEPTHTPDFYTKKGDVAFTRDFLTSKTDLLRHDFEGIRQQLGFTTGPTVNPLSTFDIGEETKAVYGMVKFDVDPGVRIDGNVGLRMVNTRGSLVGNVPIYVADADGNLEQDGFRPLNRKTSYTDWLPSLNLRLHLMEDLQLRLSASKTITRPNFNNLSPSVTVVPASGLANSGNPDLEPLRSDNLDASLEYYFGDSSSVYVAGFYRKVKGFLSSSATPGVVIDGNTYTLTQPINGGDGTIKGVEIGYTQFFDFLPGLLSGLGLQANYTHVDSKSPSPLAGETLPLPNLSPNSYNIIAMYEKGPVSARVAYNYRSSYYSGLAYLNGGLGVASNFREGYGWLDASATVDVTSQVSLTFEGSNLTRTKSVTYYGTPLQPNGRSYDDRQFTVGVRFRW